MGNSRRSLMATAAAATAERAESALRQRSLRRSTNRNSETTTEKILIDSGAVANVCPLDYAKELQLHPAPNHSKLSILTGMPLEVHGLRDVDY